MSDDSAYHENKAEKQSFIKEKIILLINEKFEIKNVSSMISFIGEISQNHDNSYELFYRGHSKTSYKIQPSVFRNHQESENIIIQELLLSNPDDFIEDKTTFDKLVRMQHYQLPTRLLDVTTNPLVALYFSCSKNTDDNGELLVFNIKKDNIKYFDSDTVSILSNLSRLKSSSKSAWYSEDISTAMNSKSNLFFIFNSLLTNKIKNKSSEPLDEYFILLIYSAYQRLMDGLVALISDIQEEVALNKKYYTTDLKKISDYLNDYLLYIKECFNEFYKLNFIYDGKKLSISDVNKEFSSLCKKLKSLIEDYEQKKTEELTTVFKKIKHNIQVKVEEYDIFSKLSVEIQSEIVHEFNNYDVTQTLLHFIKDEKPAFRHIINFEDLNKVVCVKAKKNNERIISQSGEFILFGNKKSLYKYSTDDDIQIIRLIIPNKNKNSILNELNILGINYATLFPDIQSRAHHIKERYGK